MYRVTVLVAVAVCAIVLCNAEPAKQTPPDDREITNAGSEGWQISWRAPLSTLERASKWNSESEPQLSVAQAVKKGREYLRAQGRQYQLPVTSVELRHINGTPPPCFAYVLQFGDSLTEGLVVVLLDGSVVTPLKTHRGPTKAAELSPFDQPVVDFMKQTTTVYVFPVKSQTATRPDDKYLRLLDAGARQALVAVLSDHANWHHGLMTIGIPPYEAGSIGFLFREQKDELVLFLGECVGGCTVEGTFRGKEVFGLLNECAQPAMDDWKQRYATAEAGK